MRIRDGGVGFRDISERALYLNTMCNIAPAIAGNADQPSKAFGPNLLQPDTEEGGWTYFTSTGCPYATELDSEIGRLKGLYHQAWQDAGYEEAPAHAVFGAPNKAFGIGVEKTHSKCFDAIRTMRA